MMKKYFVLPLMIIIFLSACGRSQIKNEEKPEEVLQPKSTQNPIRKTADLFDSAIADRDPAKCEKIEDPPQRKSCIDIIAELQANDSVSVSAE